jgi:cytochrome c oxidase subunit III
MPVLTENKKAGGITTPPRWRDPFGFGGGDGGGDSEGSSFPVSRAQLATWLVMTGVTMLFAGLSSAYVVLRGSPAWQTIELPPLLWVNTLVLIASSVTLEIARFSVKRDRQRDVSLWLGFSAVLGIAFLTGQLVVWRELVHAGVYLPSTLHSSFFYVLTSVHGLHIIGGIIALGFVFQAGVRGRLSPASHEPLKLGALYWHFMDAVWISLFLLLLLA